MKFKPTSTPGHVVVELARQDDAILASAAGVSAPFRLKQILVPVDFSTCSRKALRYAVPFAQQFGASLTLIHVVHVQYAIGSELGIVDYPVSERQRIDCSEKQLAVLGREEIPRTVAVQTLVRTGQPAQQIVAAAVESGSDLILLSTHGRTGLKHVFLGSVAENVVRYAPCPVLVVREREHEFAEGP